MPVPTASLTIFIHNAWICFFPSADCINRQPASRKRWYRLVCNILLVLHSRHCSGLCHFHWSMFPGNKCFRSLSVACAKHLPYQLCTILLQASVVVVMTSGQLLPRCLILIQPDLPHPLLTLSCMNSSFLVPVFTIVFSHQNKWTIMVFPALIISKYLHKCHHLGILKKQSCNVLSGTGHWFLLP